MPKASTRRPSLASAAARSPSGPSSKSSGAPSTWETPSSSTPLQRQRDENGTCAAAVQAGAWKRSRIGAERRVGARRARGEPAERLTQLVRVDALGRDELEHAQARLRQRPRLVEADQVDRRERLDRVQLLRERAPPGHPQGCDGVGQAREQDQALGDDRDDRRDGRRDGLVEGRPALPQRVAEQDAERDDQGDEREQQVVEGALERRAGMPERPRLAGDPCGVALVPDRRDHVVARPFCGERPRADLVARACAGPGRTRR